MRVRQLIPHPLTTTNNTPQSKLKHYLPNNIKAIIPILMKVKIKQWNAVATWVWDIGNEDKCIICQLTFESPCPKCKCPGDDCVPSTCNHHFHLHCIIRWTQQGSDICPLCRKKWNVKY